MPKTSFDPKSVSIADDSAWKADTSLSANLEANSAVFDGFASGVSTASDALKSVVDGGILGQPTDPFQQSLSTPFGLTIEKPVANAYTAKYTSVEADTAIPSLEDVIATFPKPVDGVDDDNIKSEISNMVTQSYALYQEKLDYYNERIDNATKTLTGGLLSVSDEGLANQFLGELQKKKDFIVTQMNGLNDFSKEMEI